ncbi:MAG: hypothetical protein C5B57_01610 [Blastocatellia bacterium]|nr:MAG: hypothetical protein C5B57_01610 [Blastocatellia bacterium]
MPWNLDDWQYLARQVVTDPKGRRWSVALMDVLGQPGDPEVPNHLLELQYASGRYFTLIYSPAGAVQREQGYGSLEEAQRGYERLLESVFDGRLDPAQPVFRENLEDG